MGRELSATTVSTITLDIMTLSITMEQHILCLF